jgi:hypothetical protein
MLGMNGITGTDTHTTMVVAHTGTTGTGTGITIVGEKVIL